MDYPNINPVAIQVGSVDIYWYGLMYLLGILAAWKLATYRAKHSQGEWTFDQVNDLIFYGALGVVLGGRLGYLLFYAFPEWQANPWLFLNLRQGGMSFHGGLLGVLLTLRFFSYKHKKHYIDVTDFVAPLLPIGLGAGRIGNFINGELYGRISDLPWAMVFPGAGYIPRHPTQLYEFLLEGVVLFLILWIYTLKPRPRATTSGLFLVGYSIFRTAVEFFREPDAHIGYLFGNWLTMGQLLTVPMFILGAGLLWYGFTRRSYPAT